MLEVVQTLSDSNLFLLAFSALIFDVPRYTLSLVSLAVFGVWGKARRGRVHAGQLSVSVIVPTFNGGAGLHPTIASLHRQTQRPVQIIIVDDGSTDDTRATAERARALGLVDMVICHGTRCGRSAAINAAARFASGDLLMTVDADTVFEPTAVERLASVFSGSARGRRELQHCHHERSRIDLDRPPKRRVSDVDQRRTLRARHRRRHRVPVRRLLHLQARRISAARRARRGTRRGSGIHAEAAPAGLCGPLRSQRLGGNARPGQVA